MQITQAGLPGRNTTGNVLGKHWSLNHLTYGAKKSQVEVVGGRSRRVPDRSSGEISRPVSPEMSPLDRSGAQLRLPLPGTFWLRTTPLAGDRKPTSARAFHLRSCPLDFDVNSACFRAEIGLPDRILA